MKTDLNQNQLKALHSRGAAEPATWIRDAFLARKQKNAAYSLRAFARDLGMSQTLLSLVLAGRRPLTLKQAYKISALLHFSPTQEKKFIDCTLAALPENAKISKKIQTAREQSRSKQDVAFLAKDLAIENFQMMSNWYHFAILDLATTTDFVSDTRWIAESLEISKVEVEAAIERLLTLGLLERKKGMLKKTALHLQVLPSESKAALRAFHAQMIDKAKEQLTKTDQAAFLRRSITGTSMAIDETKLEEAKIFVREFEKEFVKRFTVGDPSGVYQLNVQLFPLTTTNVSKGKNK